MRRQGRFLLGRSWRTIAVAALAAGVVSQGAAGMKGKHFAVNLGGDYAGVAAAGFDLADVSSAARLDGLPKGLLGVLWLGNGYNTFCHWRLDDAQVTAEVQAARGHPNFSGIYYISDEPHPAACPDAAARVAARTELIHSLDPDGRTFIIVENASKAPDEFRLLANSADLIGVDPYPCNSSNALTGCNLAQLRGRIMAARDAGIAVERIVPVFQAFGQACAGMKQPWYRLPTEDEMVAMLRIWDELVPAGRRPFDMTYSWAAQKGISCPTLKGADGEEWPNLRRVVSAYFTGGRASGLAGNTDE